MTNDSIDFVDDTHLTDGARITPKGDHERGPPNRINDLDYSDWMKYQKSFYRYPGDQTAVAECVYFFTKEQYNDGGFSRTLLLGFDDVDPDKVETQRVIDHQHISSVQQAIDHLESLSRNSYEFILIDFRKLINSVQAVTEFLDKYATKLWSAIRCAVVDDQFAGVFTGLTSTDGSGYPLPWAIAGSCRDHVRLKDEKIALIEESDEIIYNLYVQSKDDQRNPTWLYPEQMQFTNPPEQVDIPPWIIPQPPARDEDEILHPAKYPETLIERFIKMFTSEGDSVFDPMVGTGSTVLAAIQNERDGYGIDLNEQYVEIAQDRVDDEYRMTLSGEIEPYADNNIIQADATELDDLELDCVPFDYVVTSPPYWSMLNNSGSENQQERRESGLPLTYSESESDVGNIEEYSDFLDTLESIYRQVSKKLDADGYLTVVVKNVKRNHIIYPLAWDLVERLCVNSGNYRYIGSTLWCQDDIGVKPFAVGTHWVSNTLHNYCLHFSNDSGE
jgi:DNA modification methylase